MKQIFKRMIEYFISGIVAFLLLFGVGFPGRLRASAESIAVKKIVSLVCDDSGSMNGNEWEYANYALQSFCGMLNSEDKLYITYLNGSKNIDSSYSSQEVDLSTSESINRSIQEIKSKMASKGRTPFQAVKQAEETLRGVVDTNKNTQYWLVVITDGKFDNDTGTVERFINEDELNNRFANFVAETMPNGTKPQVNFLAIGSEANTLREDSEKGIFTYQANSASEIITVMSEMADKISGRTRLSENNITKRGNTIQVSSTIPLLNIVVLSQGVEAKIVKAVDDSGNEIPVQRTASFSRNGRSLLVGESSLLANSTGLIGAGSYTLTFDRTVEFSNIDVLFEPALETRMTFSVNGKIIEDHSALNDLIEGDKISVSCKIYEMGTDNEINPNLLPEGTTFSLSVREDGAVAKQTTDYPMRIDDWDLSRKDTEIIAVVSILGFNPITYSVRFTPKIAPPASVFKILASYGSGGETIRYENLENNANSTVEFRISKYGQILTEIEEIKALSPVITVSPNGNEGTVSYSEDGAILYTAKKTLAPQFGVRRNEVEVLCKISNGVEAKINYSVILPEYQISSSNAAETIKKTQFYENGVGVKFTVRQGTESISKKELEQNVSISLDKQHDDLELNVTIDDDGTVFVVPYSEEQYVKNWFQPWEYLKLKEKDIFVTLTYGDQSATATINVKGENSGFVWLNVVLPILFYVIIGLLVIRFCLYIIKLISCFMKKPKFSKNALLYTGIICFQKDENKAYQYLITNFTSTPLYQYNSWWKYQKEWKPSENAKPFSVNGIGLCASGSKGLGTGMKYVGGGVLISDYSISRIDGADNNPAVIGLSSQFNTGIEIEFNEIPQLSDDAILNKEIKSDQVIKKGKYYIRVERISTVGSGSYAQQVIDYGTIFIWTDNNII